MTSLAFTSPRRPPSIIAGLAQASPVLWRTSLVFLVLFALAAGLAAVDPRLFNGISVWIKPAKFFLSLAVHMMTLGFGILLLPEGERGSRSVRAIAWTMAAMAALEMAYITIQAGRGEASHFNVSTPLTAALYSAMGIGAALMMVVTFLLGVKLLRVGGGTLMARATGAGFILAAVLTLVVGFTLGGQGSHWIGGDHTDATGLPLLGWSTTGGDLRAAHFIGLHLAQALPLAALTGRPALVWVTGVIGTALTAAAYVLALNGIPPLIF